MSNAGNRILRYAQQSVLTTAIADGSLNFVEIIGDAQLSPEKTKIDRGTRRGDNEMNPRLDGPNNPTLSFQTYCKGNGTQAADGVAPVAAVELTELLDATFGASVSTTGQGDTSDAVDAGTGAQLVVDAAPGTPIANGNAALILGTTSQKLVAREIEALATDTYTLCRGLTDDTGSADTPDESQVVYASATWYLNVDNEDHDFLHFSDEGDTTRYDFFGCTPSGLTITVPDDGGYVTMDWSLDANQYTEPGAPSGDAFSLAAGGTPIQAVDSPVWIDATPYFARGLVITIELGTTRKTTPHGLNGYHGHVVPTKSVSITGALYQGTDTFESARTDKATFEADTATQDLLIQVGRDAGAAMAIRMPTADISMVPGIIDGQDVYNFTAMGTRSDDQTNRPGPARLHLF